ncbi:transport and Golgi organization protein 1 [Drosophila nasuta]|uniref:transport and Golgi organization protein 1 n=1 Tax=Drosophila nasuta TaxID=42062 RepID=UPI00295E9219|nr:transport and Golgi organization protein 1 [Drosophila nasuta]
MRPTKANAQTKTLRSDSAISSSSSCLTITLLVLSLLSCLPTTTWAALSDKRLCADEKCEQIISMGSAKINYASGEAGMISFKIHSPVRILSKSAGSNPKLWGVEVNGRRGYANKDFIMEKKIFVSEKDLKYELPVAGALPAAKVNNPEQAEQKKLEAVEQVQPPVLNASEGADDLATTTTSPLDALKLSLLTEQTDQSGSNEATASTPITPVQPNIQLVDGTELPLEVLPATTEASANLTEPAKQAVKIDELPTTTISSDEEFDYEEDDSDVYEEADNNDDDADATLDSKDNDIPNDRQADNKAAAAAKIEASILSSQAAEKIQNLSIEAEAKHAASVETPTPIAAAPEAAAAAPSVSGLEQQAQLKKDEEKIVQSAAEPAKELPIVKAEVEEPKVQIEELSAVNAIKDEQPKEPAQDMPAVKDAADQQLKKAVDDQPTIQAAAQPAIETPVQPAVDTATQSATPAQLAIEIPTKPAVEPAAQPAIEAAVQQEASQNAAKQTTDEIDSFEAIAALHLQDTPPAAQVNEVVSKEPVQVADEKPQVEATPVPEALQVENNASVEASAEQAQPDIAAQAEAQKAEEQLKVETTTETAKEEKPAADLPVETKVLEDLPVEAQPVVTETVEVQPVEEKPVPVQPIEQQPKLVKPIEEQPVLVQPVEQQPILAQPIEEQPIPVEQQPILPQPLETQPQTDPVPVPVEPQPIESQPAVEQPPSSLPPLFNKENFNDPNEYYKQLQEQHLEQAYKRLEKPRTTPTPASHDAYEAVYEQEATPAPVVVVEEVLATGSVEPIGQQPVVSKEEAGPGLFTTIMDTVNSFISNQGQKEPETAPLTDNDELHRLLYPDRPLAGAIETPPQEEGYCKRPLPGNCHASINLDNFAEIFAAKVVDHSVLLLCVGIAAASSLCFISFYYCCCNGSQEGALLAKLNHLERSLLASHKENLILKHDLMTTRTKLSSIEDNSFGSNDMVAALKKQLETELYEKAKLQEQVTSLEKDLDNAAEAGLELNKMLSEVLNGQNGDEAFMNTVEELQRQLNDQEKIIIEINGSLADKSRENSELQYTYTESTTRLTSEMKSLQQDNYELEMEKAKLQTRLEEMQAETEQELAKALEARNYEMQRLQHQIMESNAKLDKEHSELQTSLAKIESLEECLKLLKQQDGNLNVKELIKSAKTRGELHATQQKFVALQTKLEQEQAAKTRLESQLQASSADVEQLKQDFNQSERDKLEAQTRLEVLSGYFREKETELQKELSLQEAKWLQHQGENASTVETQTLMKNEIQTLKSQNDELRAEIEAQIASHKAQMGTLENRAHESWLAARQSERRCEEAQAEAAGLRRKLTTMASGGAAGDMSSLEQLPASANGSMLATELNNNPSPLPLPLPVSVSPGLINMPNPLPFLPPPFSLMGLPPPFMPPAGGAGGARLPPLGRMRSPPPASSSRGGDRYDDRDDRDDYSDYDDYDDEEEDERLMDRRRRHSGSWGRGGGGGHRDDYMHSPRTYRSLSPSDSRYNYNDTETDFSPPPSPLPPAPRKSSRPLNEV